jgi:hypothetical protein
MVVPSSMVGTHGCERPSGRSSTINALRVPVAGRPTAWPAAHLNATDRPDGCERSRSRRPRVRWVRQTGRPGQGCAMERKRTS